MNYEWESILNPNFVIWNEVKWCWAPSFILYKEFVSTPVDCDSLGNINLNLSR